MVVCNAPPLDWNSDSKLFVHLDKTAIYNMIYGNNEDSVSQKKKKRKNLSIKTVIIIVTVISVNLSCL